MLLTKFSPRLLVLDTFNSMRPGRKPTSDLVKEDYDLIHGIRRLGEQFHCANLILHHSSLTKKDDSVNSGAGTHGLAAAASAILSFTRKRGEHDAIMAITGNDIERETEHHFTRDQQTGFWRLAGPAEDFLRSKERREILEALKEKGRVGPTAMASHLGKPVGTVKPLMRKMWMDGEICNDDGEYFLKPVHSS